MFTIRLANGIISSRIVYPQVSMIEIYRYPQEFCNVSQKEIRALELRTIKNAKNPLKTHFFFFFYNSEMTIRWEIVLRTTS
jgi:hypothetical protein